MSAPTLTGPLAFFTVAESLLTAVNARLASPAATGVERAPQSACVVPGAIADDECTCGELRVAIVRTYYSDNPPAEQGGFTAGTAGASSACGPPYIAADLAVRMMRCAPNPDQAGRGPTCAALTAAARQVESDAYEVRTAVSCALGELVDEGIEGFLIQAQPREGPAGSCVGSQLNVAVWLGNVCADC